MNSNATLELARKSSYRSNSVALWQLPVLDGNSTYYKITQFLAYLMVSGKFRAYGFDGKDVSSTLPPYSSVTPTTIASPTKDPYCPKVGAKYGIKLVMYVNIMLVNTIVVLPNTYLHNLISMISAQR